MAKDDDLLKKPRRRNACVFGVCSADLSQFLISNFCNQPGVTSFYEITAYVKVKSLNYQLVPRHAVLEGDGFK